MRGNFLVCTLNWSYTELILGLCLPYNSIYILQLGGPYIAVSLASYLPGLIRQLACIPGGYVADYYGRRKMIIIGTYLRSMSYCLIAFASDWATLVLAISLVGAFEWFVAAEFATLHDAMPKDKRATAWATFYTIHSIITLPSPVLGGYLLDTYGTAALRVAWFATGLADVVAGTLYLKRLEESLIAPEKAPKDLGPTPLAKFRTLMAESFNQTREVLKWMPKNLKTLIGIMAIQSLAGALTAPFLVVYALESVHITGTEWGWMGSAIIALQLALTIPGGNLADKYGKVRWLYADLLVAPIAVAAFILSSNFPQMLLARILPSALVILASSSWSAIRTDMMPKEKRGRLQAIIPLFHMPANMLGAVLGGYLYGLQEVYPFYVSIVLLSLFIPVFIKFFRAPDKLSE